MRRLLFALVLLVFGGMFFASGTPAHALTSGPLTGISKTLPASNIEKARCWWYYGRLYCRRYYYFRPYCYRRCYRHRRHWHCYCRW